jgi:type VI secretion system protein ImpH
MADPDRTSSRPVTQLEEIAQAPYAFDFFQAIRRMDCAHPDKPRTGHSSRAADDVMRFGQEASMAFAPATLQAVERKEGRPPRLIQRFFGLLGPQGPLPVHMTEYVRDRQRNFEDHTLLRFFDTFHHRMVSFFYRAWARVRPTVSFDNPASDRFGDYVSSIFGMGMRPLTKRDALPDLPKRHFAGLMSCQTRHAEGLLAILKGYFRLPVEVHEFVGQWIELPANCRCLLGQSSARLGMDTTVGSHVWDCQQKFRITFGPLSLDDYYRMLPSTGTLDASTDEEDEFAAVDGYSEDGVAARRAKPRTTSGVSLERLTAAVRGYVGDQLQWDLQLYLRKEELPPLGLGTVGHLGWSSWIMREPMQRDPGDLVLDAMETPEPRETIEYRHVRKWHHTTLGQSRDGRYIVATIGFDGPDTAYIDAGTLQATAG